MDYMTRRLSWDHMHIERLAETGTQSFWECLSAHPILNDLTLVFHTRSDHSMTLCHVRAVHRKMHSYAHPGKPLTEC